MYEFNTDYSHVIKTPGLSAHRPVRAQEPPNLLLRMDMPPKKGNPDIQAVCLEFEILPQALAGSREMTKAMMVLLPTAKALRACGGDEAFAAMLMQALNTDVRDARVMTYPEKHPFYDDGAWGKGAVMMGGEIETLDMDMLKRIETKLGVPAGIMRVSRELMDRAKNGTLPMTPYAQEIEMRAYGAELSGLHPHRPGQQIHIM
jgi:hypothetical protein